MQPRTATKKSPNAAKKPGTRAKKGAAKLQPEMVQSSVPEENKVSEMEDPSSPVEETEVTDVVPSAAGVEEVSPAAGEGKVVTTEEVSGTTVVVEEETRVTEVVTRVTEVVVEEKISEVTSEDITTLNVSDVKEGDDMLDEDEPEECSDGDEEDEGAKQDVVEEVITAADIEDAKGVGEGDKSGSDEDDNEDEEDPSVYMQAPLTDRKKQKEFEIFVGGLDKEAVEEDLIKVFGAFGKIQSARIVRHPTTQKSKGYAFIRYATFEQAKKVLVELKDGIEVRAKRVGISLSQDNDTLYMGNICKTWTKEQVLETLKGFGIEQIDEIYLPDDPKNEGKCKGFALLEFSTHSDAMAAFQRLRKPDAVFGSDRSAKVAFAQSSIHPSEEALSQVKTVFIEGLTDSWDEEKVKELCKQYGEIEKVQLSRNLGKKRKDFGFVAFTSRESALACVEGINNAQVGEGDVKVKANLAKPQNKGRQAKHARGGFKVKKEGEKVEETEPSKMKGKGVGGKGKVLSRSKKAKGGKPSKPQGNLIGGQGARAPSRSERANHQSKGKPAKGEKRGRRDMDTGYSGQSSKRARGNTHGRATNDSGNRRNKSHHGRARPNFVAASATYGNPYAQVYAASASSYQGHAYGAASGSKRSYSDMEPHAGYVEPGISKQGRDPHGYGPRRTVGFSGQGSSGATYGGVAAGSVAPPSYVPRYSSYAGYEGGGAGGVYGYPSNAAYPPRRAYY